MKNQGWNAFFEQNLTASENLFAEFSYILLGNSSIKSNE